MPKLLEQAATQTAQKEITLYDEGRYFDALGDDISQLGKGDRLSVLTMSFEPSEPAVSGLLKEVAGAADRGADIMVGVDAYSFMLGGNKKSMGPLWLPLPVGQGNYRKRLATLDDLAERPNFRYSILNKPGRMLSNPCAGRSHIKTAVVNDRSYITGSNLHDSYRSDMAVSLDDPLTADWLFDISKRIVETGETSLALGDEDQSFNVDATTDILLDVGMPRRSLILDEAMELIDEADETVIVPFQYFPGRKMLMHLAQASGRGVDVRTIYNHPSSHNALIAGRERFARTLARMHHLGKLTNGQLPADAWVLHSKALVTEQAAIVGSHNFVEMGVRFGTSEMSLLRKDPAFATQVGNLLLEQASRVQPVSGPPFPRPALGSV